MNTFKVGDKVKFIDNELNRAEFPNIKFAENYRINSIEKSGGCHIEGFNLVTLFHPSRFELVPKPLLADAKEGDPCQRRDGKWVQIEERKEVGHPIKADGYYYWLTGVLFSHHESGQDIIHTEPLAQEGSAEWAWQMAKLGNETKCGCGKIRVSKSGLIEVCYNGMAYAMPITQSPENRAYTIKRISECSPTGWQIYEPAKPEPPFAKVKVGDYVEIMQDTSGKKWSEKVTQIDSVGIVTWHAPDGNSYSDVKQHITRILKPSEVVVNFGSFKGTVEILDANRTKILVTTKDKNGNTYYSEIAAGALNPATAEIVKELLAKQQKGE